jgi:hypothetical protein
MAYCRPRTEKMRVQAPQISNIKHFYDKHRVSRKRAGSVRTVH